MQGRGAVSVPSERLVPPSLVCALAPVLASSPLSSVVALPFPSPGVDGPLVVPCSCDVVPQVPCSCGCEPVTLRPSSPPCRRPSLWPFPFRCPGGGLLVRSVGRRWFMPGSRRSGASNAGFQGCRGGKALNRVLEEGFSCPLAAWRPPGRCRRVGGGAGEDFLEGVEAGAPLAPARPPRPPHPAAGRGQTTRRGPRGQGGGGKLVVLECH